MDALRTTDRARTCVILLALAATALVFYLPTYDQFILPKIAWIKVLTEILVALTALRLATGGDFRIRIHWLNFVLAAFVGWKALSWFWAESRPLADDDIRWWTILLVWCLLFQDWLGRDRQRLMLCAGALLLSALALALWVLLQDFAIAFYGEWLRRLVQLPTVLRDPLRSLLDLLTGAHAAIAKLPDWRGRLWAGLGNTNHIADYLALLFPMMGMQCLLAQGKWRELLTLLTLVVSYAALIACYSVGSNGGLIPAGAVMLVLLGVHETGDFWRKRALRLAVLGALFVAVTAFYVVPHRLNPHPGGIFGQAFASERWREGWPTRVAIWLTSLEMIRHHPRLGIGAGNFTYGYTETLSPRVLSRSDLAPYAGLYTNAAHNEPIQAWVETGLVGLLLLLLLWVVFARALLKGLAGEGDDRERRRRTVLLAMMVAFIAHSLMNFTLQLPTSSLMFVSLIAAATTFGYHREAFAATVRTAYPGFELDLETTGMRRIESVGLRLARATVLKPTITVAAVVFAFLAVTNSIRPLEADAFFNRAKLAFDFYRDLPAAEEFARKAVAIHPNHHTARKLLGRVLLQTGRDAEARQTFEKVSQRESVFDFYKELGFACWRLGDREAAGRAWTTYFARCPQLVQRDADFFAFFAKEFPQEAAAVQRSPAHMGDVHKGLS